MEKEGVMLVVWTLVMSVWMSMEGGGGGGERGGERFVTCSRMTYLPISPNVMPISDTPVRAMKQVKSLEAGEVGVRSP